MMFFIIVSCQQSADKGYSTDSMTATTEALISKNYNDDDNHSTQTIIPTDRKLIKEADLSWETNNLDKTHQLIINKVKMYNAYISSDNQYKDDYQTSNDITVKIPADKFDDFLKALQSDVKNFEKKNIRVLDVTEEYVDVDARIKTKKELEERYLEILKKANSVEDILNVESQLNNVRTEIESAEARMKVLNHQITLSTVNISFYKTTSAPVSFFGEIGKNFIEGWNSILHFILGLISIWPFVLIIGGIIYYINKKRKQRL